MKIILKFIVVKVFLINCLHVVESSTSAYEKDVTLTSAQAAKLEKFKSAVKGESQEGWMSTDLFLLKILRSNEFDLDLAKQNLRKTIQWRKENRMDEILTEDFSDVEEFARYSLDIKDKFGQPVLYSDASVNNMRRAIIIGKQSRVLRHQEYVQEKFFRTVMLAAEKYKNVTRGIVITNLDRLSFAENLCLQCIAGLQKRVQGTETYYPEMVETSIVVNAPSFVLPIVQTAIGFMKPENRKRIVVLGRNKGENLKFFRTFMDDAEIPKELGGNKELDEIQ